jgi:hypothetical protein
MPLGVRRLDAAFIQGGLTPWFSGLLKPADFSKGGTQSIAPLRAKRQNKVDGALDSIS